MKLGEFFISLGFDVDDKKLKEFNSNLKSGLGEMLKLSAVAASTVYAINSFVSNSVAAATAMRNFNSETGNSIDNLQKWQIVASRTNSAISTDQVTASFQSMAKSIADIESGKGSAGQLSRLGIPNARGMDVGEVLKIIRENYEKNKESWAKSGNLMAVHSIMQEFGFDLGMLNALKMSNDEFEKFAQNKGLSIEQIQKLVKLGDAMTNLKADIELFKGQLSAEWSPKLIEIINAAIPAFVSFSTNVSAVGLALADMWHIIEPIQWPIIGFLSALAVKIGLMTIAAWPFTTAIIAISAAVNDLGRALRGLDSFGGKALLFLLNTIYSEDGSNFSKWKKSLAEAGNGTIKDIAPRGRATKSEADLGYTLVPQDFINRGNLVRFYEDALNPANKNDMAIQRMMQQNQTNMNNVWNIQSTGDATELADEILELQQRMLDNAQAEQNNGVRY